MPRPIRTVPWLEQRSEVFYACWYEPQAKRTHRFSLRTKDPVEAKDRFAAFLVHGAPIREPERLDCLTVVQSLDDYLKEHVATKVADPVRQENAISHLKEFFGPTPLRLVDIPLSRQYADARRRGDIGGGRRKTTRELKVGCDATIRRELVVLGAAARHALSWRRITASDMPSIELPQDTRSGALSDNEWLTREELAYVLSSATGALRDFIILAYDSASRRGAIECLTKFQVDLRAGRVNLRHPRENPNKSRSKKRRPVVPIGPEARPVYERLCQGPSNNLFGDPIPDFYRPFRRLLTNIGLEHKARPHVLRHSRASHLLQDGIDIWHVAKLLGDTVATVEKVYGHFSPDFLATTIREQVR